MDDSRKKGDRSGRSGPDESWVERLRGKKGEAPAGVTVYLGLLRQKPNDDKVYELYLGLDMRACLQIQKEDVVHWEDLPADKSPFGSLGGSRVFVRDGATIKSIRTATSTFESGAGDEFDLDVRLGRSAFAGTGGGNATIPETGCGAACETIPPFTQAGCQQQTAFQTFCGNCTIDTCPCPPTQGGKTCGVNCQITRAFTCISNCPSNCQTCATCPTACATQCGTCATNCGTCNTQCGTCRVNTCNTKCGQETCGACTHVFTQCNQHGCSPL